MISYKYTQSFSPIEDCYVNIKEKSIHYPNGFDFGPVINKRFIGPTIKCSDDDWEFFLKYGKVDLIGWHEQTPKEKEDFKKFLQLYQSFWELYYEYYEDLCLYAIMYRNIKKLKPTTHRLESKKSGNNIIIDDAYNSNPVGSKMALDVLNLMDGTKIVVTPGMIELGEEQYKLNKQFGKYISEVADYVILVGEKQTKPIL